MVSALFDLLFCISLPVSVCSMYVCMYVHYCYAIHEIYGLTRRERSEGLVSDGTGEGGVLYIYYIYRTSPFPDVSLTVTICLSGML